MTGGRAAGAGLVAGAAGLGLAVTLFARVVGPALEIRRYGEEIEAAIAQVARNLEPLDGLGRTQELGGALPGLALAYLDRAGNA